MIHARAVALAAPHRTLAPLAPRHFSTLLAPSKTLHDGLFGNFEVAVQFGVRAEVYRRANDDGDEGAEDVSGEPNDGRERLGPLAKRRTELLAHRLLQREVGVLGAVHRRLLGGHQQGLDAVPDHVPEGEDEDDDGAHDGPGEEADVDEVSPGDHRRGGDLLPRHVELELGDGTDGEVLRDGFGGVDGVVDAALGEPAGALDGVDGRAAREAGEMVGGAGETQETVEVMHVREDAVAEEKLLQVPDGVVGLLVAGEGNRGRVVSARSRVVSRVTCIFFRQRCVEKGNARGRATALARREGSGSGSEEYLYVIGDSPIAGEDGVVHRQHECDEGVRLDDGPHRRERRGFRVWVRVVRAHSIPVDVLPSQTREDVPRRLLYHSHAARHRFGRPRRATCGACALGRAGRDDEYTKVTRSFWPTPVGLVIFRQGAIRNRARHFQVTVGPTIANSARA